MISFSKDNRDKLAKSNEFVLQTNMSKIEQKHTKRTTKVGAVPIIQTIKPMPEETFLIDTRSHSVIYPEAPTVKQSKKISPKNKSKSDTFKTSFQERNDMFHDDIMRISRYKSIKLKSDTKYNEISQRKLNSDLLKKVNVIRYRDNVYKAAGKISMDVPPFPIWSYKMNSMANPDIVAINVGGKIFQVLKDTIDNIPNTKLKNTFENYYGNGAMYFDRDAACFSYVLNFYRTGRLHAPTNSCLSFFEEELNFWGINEDLMEPCCYSQYMAYKSTCDILKRYSDPTEEFVKKDHDISCTYPSLKEKLYLISTSSDNGVLGRWYSVICSIAIILAVCTMIFSTTVDGRIDKVTRDYSPRNPKESLSLYFGRTEVKPTINFLEMILVGFFVADLYTRFTLCPNRFLFYSDAINWIDFIATLSSLMSIISRNKVRSGEYKAYILLMKVPRVFRLFRLTRNLRLGTEALVLTLRARSSELRLVLILTLIAMTVFGALMYVVELINERKNERISQFKSVYDGMWFAIVTMGTVGYGDITPQSSSGYVIGFFCILTGIIISQLPVPIFLNKFADFYSQIQSRQRHVTMVLNKDIDPENFVVDGKIRRSLDENFKPEDVEKVKGFSLPF